MKEIERLVENRVVQSLEAFPVVYIAGPRQSGKTTLVKHIAATEHKAAYFTFDDLQLRMSAQSDPDGFLRKLKGPVVLDEVQMVPELFRPLKILVDENRSLADAGRGQFLLTGSASVMALPALSDALVGRMALHQLYPFSVKEIHRTNKPSFIDSIFSNKLVIEKVNNNDYMEIMLKASFPELLYLNKELIRYEWCNGYINTILQRDVRSLMEIEKVEAIPDMLRLLSIRTGSLLNASALSREIGLNHITVKKYRLLLENLFLTYEIAAWSVNLGKRLIKSPKVYSNDLNILSYFLNINLDKLATQNPILFGRVIENFVVIELIKQLTFSKIHARLYHYRTASGNEVDFILEGQLQEVVGIEVKSKTKVNMNDFRQLRCLKEELGERFQRGVVLYLGEEVLPFGDGMWAIPIAALW